MPQVSPLMTALVDTKDVPEPTGWIGVWLPRPVVVPHWNEVVDGNPFGFTLPFSRADAAVISKALNVFTCGEQVNT